MTTDRHHRAADLAAQREFMRADILATLDPTDRLHVLLDVDQPLPHGQAQRIGEMLGLPERAGAQQVRDMWSGRRRYRRRAKVF